MLRNEPTVLLRRRVAFSAGHRYWSPALDAEANRARFGPWASAEHHGHNYVLEAVLRGAIDASTGMVVNIKSVDDLLQREVVGRYDQRSLDGAEPAFQTLPATLENFLKVLAAALAPSGTVDLDGKRIALDRLRLEESPRLRAELDAEMNLTLIRSYEFAASHRLHNPALSEAKNRELYGKCNNVNGHGHNYVLEVVVGGEPDPASGMLARLDELDALVMSEVVERYDHKHLNLDMPEFAGKIPTSEVVAREIFDRLDARLGAALRGVRLQETARNVFEVTRA